MKKEVVIYTYKNKDVKLSLDSSRETIWATQAEIAEVFDIDRSVVTKHINGILKTNEVDLKGNVQKMHIANSDKPVAFYSLDLILAVGYRTNSTRAIGFRKWASSILRSYITKGFAINERQLIGENLKKFVGNVNDMKLLLTAEEFSKTDVESILSLVNQFAETWFSLGAYDRDEFNVSKVTKKKVNLTVTQLQNAFVTFTNDLRSKDDVTEFFGKERNQGSIDGILGAVMQSFGGTDVYKSIEEKAAHLLYFIIKNHPFLDGNKRHGAFAFVWFLARTKVLDITKLSSSALTAITLLIAQSKTEEKEKMIMLVISLISRK